MENEGYEKKIFANNLRHYMDMNGENQNDLAAFMCVTKAAVSSWTNGQKIPRMDKMEKLAAHYGITKSMLLEDRSGSDRQERLIKILRMLPDESLDKILDYAELLLLQHNRKED